MAYHNELFYISLLGIFGIITLEIIALLKGVNGTMFGASMSGISVIIGWTAKSYIDKRNKK